MILHAGWLCGIGQEEDALCPGGSEISGKFGHFRIDSNAFGFILGLDNGEGMAVAFVGCLTVERFVGVNFHTLYGWELSKVLSFECFPMLLDFVARRGILSFHCSSMLDMLLSN